jgi:WD40 repeat protein
MNRRVPLDDAAIAHALSRVSELPLGLEQAARDQILQAVAVTPQRQSWLSWPAARQARVLAFVAVIALLLAGAGAIALGTLLRPRPAPTMEIYHHNGVIVTVENGLSVADYPDHDQAIAINLPYFGNPMGRASWSPDGRHLAASVNGEVKVGDVGTRAVRTLWTCGVSCWVPAWSPDGEAIAIGSGSGSEVTLVSPSGALISHFALPGREIQDLAWAPDSERLLVAVDMPMPDTHEGIGPPEAHGTGALLVVSRGGDVIQDLKAVHGDGAGVWDADWSPDGRTIAYIAAHWDGKIAFQFSLETIRPDGTGHIVIVKDAGACFCAGRSPGGVAWSPDGTRIAYGKAGDALYVIRPDGSEETRVSGYPLFPAWRPVP